MSEEALRTHIYREGPVYDTYEWTFARYGRAGTPKNERVVLGHSWKLTTGFTFKARQTYLADMVNRSSLEDIRKELASSLVGKV